MKMNDVRYVVFVLITMLFCSLGRAAEAPELKIASDTLVTILSGDSPVLAYRSVAAPFKPYVQELRTPDGVQVLRDSPYDHVHHHGLMFALGVDGVDFWTEASKTTNTKNVLGSQVVRQNEPSAASIVDEDQPTTIRQTIDWLDSKGVPRLLEMREISLHAVHGREVSLGTWKCRLRAATGRDSAELWGRHYFGLGMRFVESMDSGGRFLNSADSVGETVRGSEKLARADWCAYVAPVDGKLVTVAMFGHRGNTRHPTVWFTMTEPFAYLSATLELHERPLLLEREQTLELIYGFALWDGEVNREEIEQTYKQWFAFHR